MCEKQPRYSTELTDEHFMKYKLVPNRKSIFLDDPTNRPRNHMNMITKTMGGAALGAVLGLPVAMTQSLSAVKDPFTLAHKTGFRKALPLMSEQFVRHFTPCFLAGSMYGLGTSVCANYRHKEDYINNIVGGITGGSVFGMWYKNPLMGFWCAVIGGLAFGFVGYTWDQDDMKRDRKRVFNMYRRYWFTDEIPAHGTENDEYKYYKP